MLVQGLKAFQWHKKILLKKSIHSYNIKSIHSYNIKSKLNRKCFSSFSSIFDFSLNSNTFKRFYSNSASTDGAIRTSRAAPDGTKRSHARYSDRSTRTRGGGSTRNSGSVNALSTAQSSTPSHSKTSSHGNVKFALKSESHNDRVYWYNDSFLLMKRLKALIAMIDLNHHNAAKNTISNNDTKLNDTPIVNMIKDLVKRHVIAREIHFSFIISNYLKYPNLLHDAIDLYKLFTREKKLKFKDKSFTTFLTGCIDYTRAWNDQLRKSAGNGAELDPAFVDMVHDSWDFHTTALKKNAKNDLQINAIHVATYLSLLSWMECTDFHRIDSAYRSMHLKKNGAAIKNEGATTTQDTPQHVIYVLSSYTKASAKCLKEYGKISSTTEQNDIDGCQRKKEIIEKVSKEFHNMRNLGLEMDSKLVAHYLEMLLLYDKISFSMKSKTKDMKVAQMAYHTFLFQEITLFTGLSSPFIQATRAKKVQTPLAPSTLSFQRFNDSYQLANVIMSLADRISKSHTFMHLSDREFARKWFGYLWINFSHDLMDQSASLSSQQYKNALLGREKQFLN